MRKTYSSVYDVEDITHDRVIELTGDDLIKLAEGNVLVIGSPYSELKICFNYTAVSRFVSWIDNWNAGGR